MKKFLLLIFTLCISVVFCSCDWSDRIEYGTYVSKTPYIKFIYDYNIGYMTTQEIEIDRKVYKAISRSGHGAITFYEYQEEDIRPSDGLIIEDNEVYADFFYEFDDEKKQLILTDRNNGNVYHLDRVGEAQTGEGLWLNDGKLLHIV